MELFREKAAYVGAGLILAGAIALARWVFRTHTEQTKMRQELDTLAKAQLDLTTSLKDSHRELAEALKTMMQRCERHRESEADTRKLIAVLQEQSKLAHEDSLKQWERFDKIAEKSEETNKAIASLATIVETQNKAIQETGKKVDQFYTIGLTRRQDPLPKEDDNNV